MPVVPSYEGFQVEPSSLPNARLNVPNMGAGAEYQAQQAAQMGQGLTQLGQVVGDIALNMQKQANDLRVTDAQNKMKEEVSRLKYGQDDGYANLEGVNALQRSSGKPLTEEYGEHYQNKVTEIEASLGNDVQRQAFRLWSDAYSVEFKEGLMQHEARAVQAYDNSVFAGTMNNEQQTIMLEWNSPQTVQNSVNRIKEETTRFGERNGHSPEQIEANVRNASSGAHMLAITSALTNNDPQYAQSYYAQNSAEMSAEDQFKVRGVIDAEVNHQIGREAAAQALRSYTAQPSALDRAYNVIAASGFAGQQLDDKDKGHNRTLGRTYFEEMLRVFDNDLTKAYAAYFGGAGAVQEAIQQAGLPENEGKNFVEFLPPEVKGSVQKSMAAFQAGQGAPRKPTQQELHASLEADPRLRGNPAALQVARSEVDRSTSSYDQNVRQGRESKRMQALKIMLETGCSYWDLPLELRESIPLEQVSDFIDFGVKVNSPALVSNSEVYQKLSDVKYLRSLSDSEFVMNRRHLTQEHFDTFNGVRDRALGRKAGGENSPDNLSLSIINQAVNDHLGMLQINPYPEARAYFDVGRVSMIRQVVNELILIEQHRIGKKLSDQEVVAFTNRIFSTNVDVKNWLSISSENLMTIKINQIDAVDRNMIINVFKSRGIDNPTDWEILRAYQHLKRSEQSVTPARQGAVAPEAAPEIQGQNNVEKTASVPAIAAYEDY